MGWMLLNARFALGAYSKGKKGQGFRKLMPSFKQWELMKTLLNELIVNQRIYSSHARCKEVQQYAEEVVFFAKKNTDYSNKTVESMLTSKEAREIVFEILVPRYFQRPFFITRIVNEHRLRYRDCTPMCYLEYVDRPGEFKPANPVGENRVRFVKGEIDRTRRGRRRYFKEGIKLGLIKESEAKRGDMVINTKRELENLVPKSVRKI